MTTTDRAAFSKAMLLLAETLNEPWSPGRTEGYWLALEDLTIEEVGAAVRAALTTCAEFFPKPAKLRELARPPVEYHLGAGADRLYVPPPDRPRLESPETIAQIAADAMAKVQAAYEGRQDAEKPKPMTPEQEAHRRAVLREQARMLLGKPDGTA